MKVRVTLERTFEAPDDADLKTLDEQMYWASRGVMPPYKQTDLVASWCILTAEGLPIPPSQYPKRDES